MRIDALARRYGTLPSVILERSLEAIHADMEILEVALEWEKKQDGLRSAKPR